jgi:hypothetical protein
MNKSVSPPKGRVPRGVRNHNPGNLRLNPGTKWQGTDCPQTDPAFVCFSAPKWGIRALVTTLRTYRKRHGLKTVAGIVGRWAPKAENDTDSYAEFVAGRLEVSVDEEIDILQWGVMRALTEAIIVAENGYQPYKPETIDAGLVAAGMQLPQSRQPALLQPTNVAAIGGTVAAAAGVVVQTMDVLKDASDHALTLGGDALGPAFALLALAAILSLAWTAMRHGRILGH